MKFYTMVLMNVLIAAPEVTGTGTTSKASRLFDYQETVLSNGLRVITLEDFSCPIVSVHVWYHVGSKNEQPDRQGFAHMFEHMMFRGTDRLGPTDHFELIRRVGGECNGYTSFDQTVYHQELPADQLGLALWLEAERMSFLRIDQEAFDTERKVVEEERRMGKSQPYGTLYEEILKNLFTVHPYRWSPIGNIAALRASTVPELRSWWMRYYVPNNATLIIAGAVAHAEALAKAKEYFEWIPRCDDVPPVTVREPQPTTARAVTIAQKNAPAPLVGVVYRTVPVSHPDAVALSLLSAILGQGNSSRIYRDLVAEKQLAVEAFAMDYLLEQDGVLGVAAVLPPTGSDLKKVQEAMAADVERMRTEKVSDRELTKARNQLLKSVVTDTLEVASKAQILGRAAVVEGDAARANDVLERMRKVTADDLLRVAKEYLAPERAMTFTVERNLTGGVVSGLKDMLGMKKDSEEDAPITGERETTAPAPGRPGERRPENYPTTAPVAKVSVPPFKPLVTENRLANGLKVMVVSNPEVPYVSIKLGMSAGTWSEEKPGSAMLALGMLTKGTKQYDEKELADELDTYAIDLKGRAGIDDSAIDVGCLSEQLDRAMELLGQVVLEPTFPAGEFTKLVRQTRTQVMIELEEPMTIARKELAKRMYGRHPYSRLPSGEPEDLDKLTVGDVKDWWHRFARPDMATLIFSGDVTPERAVELAEKTFGSWKAEGPAPKIDLPAPPKPSATTIYLVNRPGNVQSQIRMGQLSLGLKDPRYMTSELVNEYFGESFGGRLNKDVRVNKGLTYGIWGGFVAGRFLGRFGVVTFTKTESTAKAVEAVLEEVRRLRTEGPSADELERTRTAILGKFVRERETPQSVANDLWFIENNDLPADYFQKLLANTARVSAKDCLTLAAEAADPDKLAIVVVGDAWRIKGELEKIAPITVIEPPKPATEPAAQAATKPAGG